MQQYTVSGVAGGEDLKFDMMNSETAQADTESCHSATSTNTRGYPSIGRFSTFCLGLSTGILSAGLGAGLGVMNSERSACRSSTAHALDLQHEYISNLTSQVAGCNSALGLTEHDRVKMYSELETCNYNLTACTNSCPTHIIVTPTAAASP